MVIAVLNSVMSAYYYIYVIVAMYMQEGAGLELARVVAKPALVAAIGLALFATIVVGVYPEPYMSAAASAYQSALNAGTIHTAALLP